MGTYVNTDSLALLAAAMILYAWASYLREDWTWKTVYSLQWEWLYVHCLIIMRMAGYSAVFLLLFYGITLQRRSSFTESSFPFQQRSSDRSSYFSSLRLVVHP